MEVVLQSLCSECKRCGLNTRTLPGLGGERLLIRLAHHRADVTLNASAMKQTVGSVLVVTLVPVDAAPSMMITIRCFEDMDDFCKATQIGDWNGG